MSFPTPQALRQAKESIYALKEKFKSDAENYDWLDARKTRNELRPNRLTHKAFDAVMMLEEKAGSSLDDLKGKQLLFKKESIGFVSHGQWKWLDHAGSRFSAQDLQWAEGYVNNTA